MTWGRLGGVPDRALPSAPRADRDGAGLLAKAHAALPAGGLVIISELLLDADRTGPAPAALMAMNMLAETVGGRNYSDAGYADWLTGAGFTEIRTVRFDAPGANGVVLGVKP